MLDPVARHLIRTAFGALLALAPALAVQPNGGPATVELPGGGTFVHSAIPGPQTVRSAMGKVLGYATTHFGARPRLERMLKSPDGTMLAATFSVTAQGRELAGLALVVVPANGQAEGAILSDEADRFRTSFQRLGESAKPQPAPAPAPAHAPAPPGPAAKLHQVAFPDGSGSMALPDGWRILSSQGGDVKALGPKGEQLRFGLPISVIDPTRPEARALGRGPGGRAPAGFVDIPFGTESAAAFKSATRQLAQKQNRRPADFTFASVKDLPDAGGGRSSFLVGEIDTHDGQGPAATWVQVCSSAPMSLGAWQMTLFQVIVPKALAASEAATVTGIFKGYRPNNAVIARQIHDQMQANTAITNNALATIDQYNDAGARSTQGMSDFLRGNTVVHDTLLNGHGRVSDDLAEALVKGRPDRFEAVPLSEYVKGIDY